MIAVATRQEIISHGTAVDPSRRLTLCQKKTEDSADVQARRCLAGGEYWLFIHTSVHDSFICACWLQSMAFRHRVKYVL